MTHQKCILVGVPLDCGKRRQGCLMGPDAYRTAGLQEALRDLSHDVEDIGNVQPAPFEAKDHAKLFKREETIGWTTSLADTAQDALTKGAVAIEAFAVDRQDRARRAEVAPPQSRAGGDDLLDELVGFRFAIDVLRDRRNR